MRVGGRYAAAGDASVIDLPTFDALALSLHIVPASTRSLLARAFPKRRASRPDGRSLSI